jgi:paraquat-inducible protein A
VRCGSPIARETNWPSVLAWTIAGLILAVPAAFLPVVHLARFGITRDSQLLTGAIALWNDGMASGAVLVMLCGIVAPVTLLLSLAVLLIPLVRGTGAPRARHLLRLLRGLALWSIPEVYVLAVLVAFIKLDALVPAEPAPGLWCQAGMSFALLVAWRRFDHDAAAAVLAPTHQ